jgi:hypothetical protein
MRYDSIANAVTSLRWELKQLAVRGEAAGLADGPSIVFRRPAECNFGDVGLPAWSKTANRMKGKVLTRMSAVKPFIGDAVLRKRCIRYAASLRMATTASVVLYTP